MHNKIPEMSLDCAEQMIQVNDVGKANGELAAWVDGKLYLHMTGIRWRTDERLRVKRFDVGIYVHRASRENVVWYDDIVLSTGYVGPAVPKINLEKRAKDPSPGHRESLRRDR